LQIAGTYSIRTMYKVHL